MKDINELLQKFEDIQDLPVSEEMLGAYMEGKLVGSELDEVTQHVSSDIHLRELLHDVSEISIDEQVGDRHPWDIYEGDYGYWELGLPPVLSPNNLSPDDDKENLEVLSVDSDRFTNEETLSIQNAENNLAGNQLNLNDMANNSRTIIYGEAGQNLSDPVYVQQPDDHSCALRSQQIVLRDFGIDIPFKDLEQIALDNGVYTNEGTYTYDIGKVLQLAGVGMHQTEGNTVDDLINELVLGHRVIVSVDAHELWYNKTISEKMLNWFKDTIGLQGGNHALIVAGVEVDPTHPENSKVILTDPGAGHLRIEYPMEQFKDAWGDSNCFMAATNNPAPYQYDASTGKEIPSNFAVQQYVNDFVANNSYQLSPDMINIPQGYQPALTDHLNVVGNVDYDTFKSCYEEMVANRIPSTLSVKEQIEEVARISAAQDNAHDINDLFGNKDSQENGNNDEIEKGDIEGGFVVEGGTEEDDTESGKAEEDETESGDAEDGGETEDGVEEDFDDVAE